MPNPWIGRTSQVLPSPAGLTRAEQGPDLGPVLMKGWKNHGRVLGEVMGSFNPLLPPQPCFAAPCCSLCPSDPSDHWGKMTISPHISWVLPDISKMLFLGCYFGREIAFHSPVLPYCPRPGIEEYAWSQYSMETCPKQEYFILILKESLNFYDVNSKPVKNNPNPSV